MRNKSAEMTNPSFSGSTPFGPFQKSLDAVVCVTMRCLPLVYKLQPTSLYDEKLVKLGNKNRPVPLFIF